MIPVVTVGRFCCRCPGRTGTGPWTSVGAWNTSPRRLLWEKGPWTFSATTTERQMAGKPFCDRLIMITWSRSLRQIVRITPRSRSACHCGASRRSPEAVQNTTMSRTASPPMAKATSSRQSKSDSEFGKLSRRTCRQEPRRLSASGNSSMRTPAAQCRCMLSGAGRTSMLQSGTRLPMERCSTTGGDRKAHFVSAR